MGTVAENQFEQPDQNPVLAYDAEADAKRAAGVEPVGPIMVKMSANCLCFVENCPLHSEAADMYVALELALKLARSVQEAISDPYGDGPRAVDAGLAKTHLENLLTVLEAQHEKLAGKVALH